MLYLIFKKLTNLRVWISGFGIFLIVFVVIFVHLQIENLKFGSITRSGDPFFASKILSTTENYNIKGNFIKTARILDSEWSSPYKEEAKKEGVNLNFAVFAVPKEFVSNNIDWTIKNGVVPVISSLVMEENPELFINNKLVKTKVVARLPSLETYIPYEAINRFEHTKFKTYVANTEQEYKDLQNQMFEINKENITSGIFPLSQNYPSKLVLETIYPEELVIIYDSMTFWKYVIWAICLVLLVLLGFKIYQLEQKNIYLMQKLGLSKTQMLSFLGTTYFAMLLICIFVSTILNMLILKSVFFPSLFNYYNISIGRHFLQIL